MRVRRAYFLLALLALTMTRVARAEPYIAVQTGYKCIVCHLNPTGGGMRNSFGEIFAERLMPTQPLPANSQVWTGDLVQNILRFGGDLRADWSRTTTPQSPTVQQFALEQLRVYTDVNVIQDRLALYVDELLAPGAAETMEAYVLYGNTADWYLKGGRFYLPFGWRLQDQTAFVRQVTGINMNSPDNGVELGIERPHWEAQFDLSNGAANAQAGSGYQVIGQFIRTQGLWRIGTAAAYTQSQAGDRDMAGLFAGLHTGPIAWLGEIDAVRQAGFEDGSHTMIPALAEMDWLIFRGNNLKLTYEYLDPELSVHNNEEIRWSALDELTPIPFTQLRVGFRRYQGIPQDKAQNQTLAFIELHGFF